MSHLSICSLGALFYLSKITCHLLVRAPAQTKPPGESRHKDLPRQAENQFQVLGETREDGKSKSSLVSPFQKVSDVQEQGWGHLPAHL